MIPLIGIVRNGKIEVALPSQMAEGSEVTVWVHAKEDNDPISQDEIARTLAAMDEIAKQFPVEEDGEDLSRAAREHGALSKG